MLLHDIMNKEVDTYKNLLGIVHHTYEKHHLIIHLITSIEKPLGSNPQIADIIAIRHKIEILIRGLTSERNISKQFNRAHKIKEIEDYSIANLKVLHEINHRDVPLDMVPFVEEYQNKMRSSVDFWRSEEGITLKKTTAVLGTLDQLILLNKDQAKLLAIYHPEMNMDQLLDLANELAHLAHNESEVLSNLIATFKDIQAENYHETRMVENLIRMEEENRDKFKKLEENSIKHFPIPKQPRDAYVVIQNSLVEGNILREAEKQEIQILHDDGRLGKEILEGLGHKYSLVLDNKDYTLHPDTNPFLRKEAHKLLDYIIIRWKVLYPEYFSKGNMVMPVITSLSRTRKEQEDLMRTNSYAVDPEKSTHLRGLAIDFGMGSISDQMAEEVASMPTIIIPKKVAKKIFYELFLIRVKNILTKIGRELKAEGIAAYIIEPGNCFHISLNPSPESVAKLNRLLNLPS
jgi:hypothetical protein